MPSLSRRRYDRVAGEDDETAADVENNNNNNNNNNNSNDESGDDGINRGSEHDSSLRRNDNTANPNSSSSISSDSDEEKQQLTKNVVSTEGDDELTAEDTTKKDEEDEDDGTRLRIVVLDPAQNKFVVPVHPSWSILRFKRAGTAVHKIGASQQRLVFMGKMLADDTVLKDVGIVKEGLIVHLFPKPRVILHRHNDRTDACNADGSNTNNGDNYNDDNDDAENGGAHVPRIVIDADEAEMRSSILVLGSVEVVEAQNNVKLLSFLLLIVSSMELLALFTIMMGVSSGNDTTTPTEDDFYPANSPELREWRPTDWIDLILNLFGFYAATLGIKATTENTRALAFRYMICTYICGVLWIIFYYWMNYDNVKENEEKRLEEAEKDNFPATPRTNGDMLTEAFFSILLPIMVWALCFYRARRFHDLLMEAEAEAEERLQSELGAVGSSNNNNDGDSPNANAGGPSDAVTATQDDGVVREESRVSSIATIV